MTSMTQAPRAQLDSSSLFESFTEFARRKNIDRPTMIRILEDVFRAIIRRKYGSDDNFDVIINTEKGDLEIFRFREVVSDDSEDIWEVDKISLSEAKRISEDFEVGEEVAESIHPDSFGRRSITIARQTLAQKIKNLEKDNIFNKYKELIGEVVQAEVYQVLSREVLFLDPEGNELVLPGNFQIPKDRFRRGTPMRAVVDAVEMTGGMPRVILSRTSPLFLERLFESEVPEVFEGIISIKKVVRDPGERAKVSVESYDDRIDPVGACVGIKGSRIHSIVRELCNENIDVINYTENQELFIARTLSPAKITSLKIDEQGKRIEVSLKPDQVSLALGRKGQNVRLASRLLEMEIDIAREQSEAGEEDVDLREFSDEIDQWIIDEFHKVGLDTAKQVLEKELALLVSQTDLEEETIKEVMAILRSEFE